MAPKPRPVSLTTAVNSTNPPLKPEPLVVVGGIPVQAAAANVVGGVKRGVTVANATVATDATSVATQFNALLVSLRAAGIIAP